MSGKAVAQGQEGSRRGGHRHHRGSPRADEGSTAFDDILAAAAYEFSRKGFDRATMRGIAARAGCDPKLLHYYFGGKDDLFTKAVGRIVEGSRLLDTLLGGGQEAGKGSGPVSGVDFLKALLRFVETTPEGAVYLGLVRNASGDPHVRDLMLGFIKGELDGEQLKRPGIDHLRERLVFAASQVLGLLIVRYVFKAEPLASMPADGVAMVVGPVVDRYLHADLPLDRLVA